jgi:tetratricopeptide (TPR) repeat protein
MSLSSMRCLLIALLLAVALPRIAVAETTEADSPQPAAEDQAAQEKKYQSCMKLAQKTPKLALKQAMDWEKAGGGDAARHCVANAYMGLKQYDDAAMELERIAQTMPQVKAPMMAQLFGQAAQAWKEFGKLELALNDVNQGLELNKNSVELLVLRATIYGDQKKYFEALDDLNVAFDLTSDRVAILTLRARAYRMLEQPDLAKDNIEMALKADPNDPDALLERGTLRAAAGDTDGARADWLKLIEIAPDSYAAEGARTGLAAIDVKTN